VLIAVVRPPVVVTNQGLNPGSPKSQKEGPLLFLNENSKGYPSVVFIYIIKE
jgi:hypothetical protein